MKNNSEKLKFGKNFDYFSNLALKLNSYVFTGYVENDNDKYYNSMMIINREGQLIANYWKWYLYIVDEEFYQPGQECIIIEL